MCAADSRCSLSCVCHCPSASSHIAAAARAALLCAAGFILIATSDYGANESLNQPSLQAEVNW